MTRDGVRLPDAGARTRAATDFTSNLVVLAGAGTGKTSLVIERLLGAIGSGIVELDRLAAITFTEKAAGELRERLAAGLDRLRGLVRGELSPGAGDEADRAFAFLTGAGREAAGTVDAIGVRALAAMEALDRATVTTIHGFCAELLRRHPVQARVDPDFVVDTGEHEVSLGLAAWDRFVVRELGPQAARPALWTALLDELSLSTLRGVALELAGFAVPDTTLCPPFVAPDARKLLAGELTAVIGAVDDLLEREVGMTAMSREYFRGVRRVFAALRDDGMEHMREAFAADSALVGKIEKNNVPGPSTKLTGVTPEELKALSARTRKLALELTRIDDALLSRVVEAVAPFALEFREDYLKRGFVSFDGLLSLARDLLRDDAAVRSSLKRRFRMILIDEFQDTDPVQHEIALYLGEHPDAHADDPFEASLEAGRLFVVGDAKQSIYRFRGADYAAYRRAVERIVEAGGEALDLQANFRSVPGVVDSVNRLFATPGGAWEASDYQPDYVPIRAALPARDADPAVEVWTVDVPRNSRAELRREAEGRLLAQSIRQLVDERRAASFRDITILFRAFTRITHYLRPLRELGVPFVVDGGRDFLRRPEVEQLMATLQALSQPADAPALLAFLRSPAGGASDFELADFKDAGGRFDWRSADGPASGRVADCFRLLQDLSRETKHLPADATVRRVVERLLLLPLGAAAFEGPQRVANLSKLAAAAGELARDGRLSLEQVVEALREGRLQDIQSDRPLSDDAAEAVRITSIHRMKGLENEWIFLPDLARQDAAGRGDPRAVLVARPPGTAPTLALRTGGAGGAGNAARVWLETDSRRHERAEETRVLYVAVTRARKRLIVLASPSRHPAPWVSALGPWGYDVDAPPEDGALLCDGAVRHRVLQLAPTAAAQDSVSGDQARRAVERYAEAVGRLRAAAQPPLTAPSGLTDGDDGAPAAGQGPTGRRDLGRSLGIVIHRMLEAWPAGDPPEIAALEGSRDTLVAMTARAEGVDPEALRREAEALLASFLASPLAEELGRLDVVGREVPMLLRGDGGRVLRGTLDLLYREPSGNLVVADYKTDRETDEAILSARYAAQLETYARGVAAALGLAVPPRTELWLLRSGRRLLLSRKPAG